MSIHHYFFKNMQLSFSRYLGALLVFLIVLGRGVSAQEAYTPGKVVFKIKAATYDAQGRLLKAAALPEATTLGRLSRKSPERYLPQAQAPAPQARNAQGKALIDLSTIYILDLAEGVSVEEALALLRQDSQVLYAEPLRILYPLAPPQHIPNDPGAANPSTTPTDFHQYYLSNIKAYEAWEVQKGSPESIIGIIDYGFRTTHEDLIDNLHPDYFDVGNNDTDLNLPHPFSYHGGAVAGIAAATPNNGIGIAGVGYNCSYLPIKAIADNFSVFNLGAAIYYLVEREVKVINMSFGYEGAPDALLEDLMNYAAINGNVALVAAAGNNGTEGRFWPASYENVLSVAGTRHTDMRWPGSNFNYEVDICAPAEFVHTTYFNCCGYGGVFNNNNSYINAVTIDGIGFNGTSFAAPQVAAAIALVRTQFPELNALQAMARVKATADNIDALNPSAAGKLGKGRLNIYRALTDTEVKAARLDNIQARRQGNKLYLTGLYTNLLHPVQALNAELAVLSAFVEVESGSVSLGTLGTLESKEQQSAFVLNLTNEINTPILFKLVLTDGAEVVEEIYFRLEVSSAVEMAEENFEICRGEDLLLQPEAEGLYALYDQAEALSPVATGRFFLLEAQDSSRVYYIANITDAIPSAALPVRVEVFRVAFETDTLLSFAQNATVLLKDTNQRSIKSIWRIGEESFEGAELTYTFAAPGLYEIELKSENAQGCLDSSRQQVRVVEGVLSLTDWQRNLQLYPNPTSDQVRIESAGFPLSWKLYNAQGQLLQAGNTSVQEAISLQKYERGLYLLLLEYQGQQLPQKIIRF
jgi:hypothetical protein